MGKCAPKLSALRYNRLLPDRAEQHLRHYPYAGIRADSHLLSADICLSCHAPIICRRHCLDSISDIFVLSVQGLSTSTSGGHPILLVPVYRGGQSVLPIFWIGAYSFQALTPKSFFGGLIGWTLPYWFLFGHAYFYGEIELFYQPFIELVTFHPITLWNFPLWEIATLGYSFLLFIVSSVHCLVAGYEDKIRTRSYLHFLIFLTFCIFVYILLQPAQTFHLLPLLLIGVSILTGHFVVLTNSRASNVFFICALAGLILLFGFNVWMLL